MTQQSAQQQHTSDLPQAGTSSKGTTPMSDTSDRTVKEAVHTAQDEAASVADTAKEQAQEVAGEARSQARQLWQQSRQELMDQTGQQQQRVAGSLRTLGQDLSAMSSQDQRGGMANDVVREVSARATRAASWLDQRDPGSLMDEARSFARQRPGTFLAIAAGLGVLGGRLSRSMVDESRESHDDTAASRQGDPVGGSLASGDIAPGTRTGPATQSTTGYHEDIAPAQPAGTDGSNGRFGAGTGQVPR